MRPTLLKAASTKCDEAAAIALLADSQLADHIAVAIRISLLEVIQKTAALAHQHQQTTAGAMILLVGLEVLCQLADTRAENRNLHFRTSSVRLMRAKFGNDVCFLCGCQHGRFVLLIL